MKSVSLLGFFILAVGRWTDQVPSYWSYDAEPMEQELYCESDEYKRVENKFLSSAQVYHGLSMFGFPRLRVTKVCL